jgi:hypothetical protein
MATIFPSDPTIDEVYEKWKWDGTVWKLIGTFDTGNALHIHNEDTTNVHGIPDTQAAFALQTYSPTEPTSPNIGDIWVDSDSFVPSVDTAVLFRWRKTATGGETSLSGNDDNSLSLNYTPNYESIFLNGILLVRGVDYIATTGTTITGLTALVANDIVEVMSPNAMSLADVYTQTQSDAKYGIIGTSAPFAIASGTITVTGSGTVTLPTGRFTQAPLVNVSVISANSSSATSVTFGTTSTTSFPVYVWSGTSASTTARTVNWTAIQMTSGSSAG